MPADEVKKLINCVKGVDYDLDNKYLIPDRETAELSDQESGILKYTPKEDNDNKELAEIIAWTLTRSFISANKVKEKFSMGNRVGEIMTRMYVMGLISDKHAKQPRKVLPQSLSEVPEKVREFLNSNGISDESISNAICKRD